VNGLKRKIADTDFCEFVSKYDIVFFNETWISDKNQTDLNIKGFDCNHIFGNKSRTTVKGRYSGGLAVYFKSYLSEYINVVKKSQEGLLWLKISPNILHSDKPAFVCHAYIPPTMSTVLNDVDLFDMIENDYNHFSLEGDVYICGDLNARTSDLFDFFIFDRYVGQNLQISDDVIIPNRFNLDKTVDAYGRKLLDLCISTGLLIVNGRHSYDQNGEFTFCSDRGSSTVDYLLTVFDNFDSIESFNIIEFNEFSDHAPVRFQLKANYYSNTENSGNNTAPLKLKMDSSKFPRLYSLIAEDSERLNQLNSLIDLHPIDHVVKEFTVFIQQKADCV